MRRRRILVTGARGFVGRAVAEGFAELGWSVIGLDRAVADVTGAAGPEEMVGRPNGIRWVAADLADAMPDEIQEVDLVVHAAWMTTDPETLGVSPAEYLGLNLRPLLTVLAYAARTRPAAFVFLSSSGVFGPDDATEGLTDAHRPTGASPYAVAKRAGELLVPSALEPSTAAHVVRLGYLYGPGETARPSRARLSLIGGWLSAALDGRTLEVRADDPARDWTFTPDLPRALERLAGTAPAGRPVHLGSSHVWRDRALAEHIASALAGVELAFVPADGDVKPPMVPSELPVLDGFRWTDPPSGLRALIDSGVAA